MKAFVVRLWAASEEVEGHVHEEADLRGVVEVIGSSEAATPFRNDTELLRLLRERRSAPTGAKARGGESQR